MDEDRLRTFVNDFELVISQGERLFQNHDVPGHTLTIMFAMKSAYAICSLLGLWAAKPPDASHTSTQARQSISAPQDLPNPDRFRVAAPKLLAAARSTDKNEILMALRECGLFELCSDPHEQLLRMELVSRKLVGRPQAVSLIELSLFAAEIGDLEGTAQYAAKASECSLSAWELHNLSVLGGVIAFESGRMRDAVYLLDESVSVCLADEYSLLECGVSAPNFMLAQKFLRNGDCARVLGYLSQCKKIWQPFQSAINGLIDVIEHGETVNLQAAGFVLALNQPGYKLQNQLMRANYLQDSTEGCRGVQIGRSPEEVVAAKMALLEDWQRDVSRKIKDTIRYLDTEKSE